MHRKTLQHVKNTKGVYKKQFTKVLISNKVHSLDTINCGIINLLLKGAFHGPLFCRFSRTADDFRHNTPVSLFHINNEPDT